MSLGEYQRKRHFDRTAEPKGTESSSPGYSFVVQKHAASHLHYDFRLELDGVLKSWAVPKGPSLDPSVKRLAMQVEDHPVEYGLFEGTIPEGEYGGGTVMLWDKGSWEPVGDPGEGYRQGKLKFKLYGQKLHGGWMLVRIAGRSPKDKNGRQWLLFKEKDADARPASDGDVLEELPRSVDSGRSMPEIAGDRDWVWGDQSASPKRNGKARRAKKMAKHTPSSHRDHSSLPKRVEVQLATRAEEAPPGDDWFHEIKFDGYRIVCRVDHGKVVLLSRNHKDWTDRFGLVAQAAQKLPVDQALLDGEIVALRTDGTTDFQLLQNAMNVRRADYLHYFVFDLLFLDGEDLTRKPLAERKQILAKLLKQEGVPERLHLSDHIEGNGPGFFREVCKKRLEGIVSKRRDRPYVPGRGPDWLKVKCIQTDEFVIGGYTDPAGSRIGFGALLLGYHNPKGALVYAGKVGTGYNDRTLKILRERLQALRQETSPFTDLARGPKGTHWVTPTLVAQVAFGSRTEDGIVRHSSFQGLREDKPATEVTREQMVPLAKVLKKDGARKAARGPKARRLLAASATYDAATQQFAGVRLTSPDKVLYPEQGITKLELASYYRMVADWIMPHIANRPVVLVRCPDGRHKDCFYQKHPGAGAPDALRQIPIKEKSKTEHYVVVDDVAGLISLAQVGALEVHAWGSREDKLEQPDRLIFDLDPDPDLPWKQVITAARQVREFLQQLGLESFVKTTGGKGLHLVVPIRRRYDWDEAKEFCKTVADAVVRADPGQYIANMSKAARHGKIFIDYLRNGRGATAIVPYSPRARDGAPVSVPLAWGELSARIHSDRYTIMNLHERLGMLRADPWERIGSLHQGLETPLKKLHALLGE